MLRIIMQHTNIIPIASISTELLIGKGLPKLTYIPNFSVLQVTKMLTALKEAGSNYKLNIQEPSGKQPLPPASFQRFLRHKKTVPGIVLTDHQDQYTNK